MLRNSRLALFSTLVLAISNPCAGQDLEKEHAISSLIAHTRSSFAGPDAAPLKAILEPLRKINPSLPEANWRALLADASALIEGDILKPGSQGEAGFRARLQALSTEELRSVEIFLRSPQYKKYQDAMAHRDLAEETTGAFMTAFQKAGPKIIQAAKTHGFKVE